MSKGSALNYRYGNKSQWRRWAWNRISERAQLNRESLVLFLAGQEAFDIEFAARKGVMPRNMIAVERDKTNLALLRQRGILTIDGDLIDVIKSWPQHKPVSVVHADFCCGLHVDILKQLMQIIAWYDPFRGTTWCFNFLRGRDGSFTHVREKVNGAFMSAGFEPTKHRGELFYGLLMPQWISSGWESISEELRLHRATAIRRATDPASYSYQSESGAQVFDSVVFRSPLGGAHSVPSFGQPLSFCASQRRRTAAVLAHHTRRFA